MGRGLKRIALLGGIAAAVLVPASALGSSNAAQHYTVAFNNPSGLPANVDQLVANAGGTITERVADIGGIGVVSSNPNFAQDIAKSNTVKAAGVSALTSVPEQQDFTTESATDNSGTYEPTGSDTQAMPDPLGVEQWDKKKLDATATGSY